MGDKTRTVPAGRYGSAGRRGSSQRWRWAFIGIALVAAVGIALLAYRNLGPAPVSAQRIAFSERPGDAMEITILVSRDDPGRPAVCIVRVRDITGAESGRKEIFVPPSNGESRLRTVIRSGKRPVTADVFGCSYDVPEYLSRPERPTE